MTGARGTIARGAEKIRTIYHRDPRRKPRGPTKRTQGREGNEKGMGTGQEVGGTGQLGQNWRQQPAPWRVKPILTKGSAFPSNYPSNRTTKEADQCFCISFYTCKMIEGARRHKLWVEFEELRQNDLRKKKS